MPFRLRYQAHDMELPEGDFVIGRSPDCQLAVDDPLVSRRHAVLEVRGATVTAKDLGSRNGVLVNGQKIAGDRPLSNGDKVKIGAQELTLRWVDEGAARRRATVDASRRVTQTLGNLDLEAIRESVDSKGPETAKELASEVSKIAGSLRLLGGVAEKALAMGNAEEAERILQSVLTNVLEASRRGAEVDDETLQKSANLAARLGGATANGKWVDLVFEVYTLRRRLLPAGVVDELYTVIRKVKAVKLTAIRAYVEVLRELAPKFGPGERFLVQRIEGLERLGALK
jgi:hypothetical protein